MRVNSASDNQDDGTTPPQVPGALPGPKRQTSWPVTFGVGAIVFGAGGALLTLPSGCMGGMVSTLMPAGAGGEDAAAVVRSAAGWLTVASLVSAVLSIWLAVAGIGLCQRRAWSVRLLWAWSVLNLGTSVLAAVGAYILCRQMMDQMVAHRRDLMLSVSTADAASVSRTVAAAVLVVGWSSPVFLLIWFARRSIREEVAGWS